MSRLLIKVCGMRDPGNIGAVSNLLPDLMGFIFYRPSPRFVGEGFTIPTLPDSVRKVGVFVNEPGDGIIGQVRELGINIVQLHGAESPGYCRELRVGGIGIIKAFSIGERFEFEEVYPYEELADFFLFDNPGERYGGTGKSFDWSRLNEYRGSTPFLLSGGLGLPNVRKALEVEHPRLAGFDFNSGLESSPGMKDVTSVKNIIQIVREHERPG